MIHAPATTPPSPGELALAVTGVSVLLGDEKFPKFGIEKMREAQGIPLRARRAAGKMVRGEFTETPPMPRAHDYKKLLDRFSSALRSDDGTQAGLHPHEVQDMVSKFPPEASDVSAAYSIVAQAAFTKLQSLFPVSSITTFTGPRSLTPADDKVWTFFSQLWVLNDPLVVFPLMATAALLKSQVDAVREFYPTLAAEFDTLIYETIAGAKAAKQSYQLPPRAETGVATWLGRRTVSYQPPKPPGAPPPPTPRGGPRKRAALAETTNQKAEAAS